MMSRCLRASTSPRPATSPQSLTKAVQQERPVKIVRYNRKREQGVFVSRAQLLQSLEHLRPTVDVIPEETGGFTLWVRELALGAHGVTIGEARIALIHDIRSYVRHFFASWDMYRHMIDMQAQMPYVLRLSLAEDDKELARMLFGFIPTAAKKTPETRPLARRSSLHG